VIVISKTTDDDEATRHQRHGQLARASDTAPAARAARSRLLLLAVCWAIVLLITIATYAPRLSR
jgi:hypothetical protein